MKQFALLLRREAGLQLRASLLFSAAAAVLAPLYFLFFAPVPSIFGGMPFERMFTSSLLPAALSLLILLAFVWAVRSALHDLENARECFLSLPCPRPLWFFAKTAASVLLMLWLWAGMLAGLLLSYVVFLSRAAGQAGLYPARSGLILGICRSPFLRLLFPLGVHSAVSFTLLLLGLCVLVLPLAAAFSRRSLRDIVPSAAVLLLWAWVLFTASDVHAGFAARALSHTLFLLSLILLTLLTLRRINRAKL